MKFDQSKLEIVTLKGEEITDEFFELTNKSAGTIMYWMINNRPWLTGTAIKYEGQFIAWSVHIMPELKNAIAAVPLKWRREIAVDFSIIVNELRKSALACTHNARHTSYNGREECQSCGCHRNLELEDQSPNSWNERKVWSEWKV
jgi:hypothetical protein